MTGAVPIGERLPTAHIVTVSSKENAMRKHTNETNEARNGKMVDGGFYLNRKTWDLVTVNGKKGVLPTNDVYVRIPALAMLAAGPVLGATLVVFLPFVGIALFAAAGLRKVLGLQKAVKAAEAHETL
jgi:hypothetical protein